MRSGKKFLRAGRPNSLEQEIGSRPAHLLSLASDVTLAFKEGLRSDSPAHKEWLADARLNGVGIGLTAGRKAGGEATRSRAIALQNYLKRNHSDLFVLENYSTMARKIITAEAKREGVGWMDAEWFNGTDIGKPRYIPKYDSLRKLLFKMISGKG